MLASAGHHLLALSSVFQAAAAVRAGSLVLAGRAAAVALAHSTLRALAGRAMLLALLAGRDLTLFMPLPAVGPVAVSILAMPHQPEALAGLALAPIAPPRLAAAEALEEALEGGLAVYLPTSLLANGLVALAEAVEVLPIQLLRAMEETARFGAVAAGVAAHR